MSIFIVGSGPVGLSVASLLGRTLPNVDITLLSALSKTPSFDSASSNTNIDSNIDVRTYALTPNNYSLLKAAGMNDHRSGLYNKMQVWDRRNPSFLKWSTNNNTSNNNNKRDLEEGVGDALGYVLEDRLINAEIENNLPNNVKLLCQTQLTGIEEIGGEGGGKVRGEKGRGGGGLQAHY
jgi:2-polyprenyl-6-methoxyphenol hydroxylase-like FAD-dependent oxidoreductase